MARRRLYAAAPSECHDKTFANKKIPCLIMKRTAHILLMLVALVGATIALTVSSCDDSYTVGHIMPDYVELRDGDILFRRGTGFTSHIVASADVNGQYSHVGIVCMTDSGAMVVHAVPDEPDYPGDPDRVKLERPAQFFAETNAQRGAIGRPINGEAAHDAAMLAYEAYKRHTLFDHNYDDSDSTSLYCCELITRVFESAGLKLTTPGTHALHLAGIIDVNCTLPSDIFNSQNISILSIF